MISLNLDLRKYLSNLSHYIEALEVGGLKGLGVELQNRKSIWFLSEALENELGRGSSLSDNSNYLMVCKMAVRDEEIFNKFKSNFDYRKILEHVSWKLGCQYASLLEDPLIIQNLVKISREEVGSPLSYPIANFGSVSPTQIRYAKITSDLKKRFKSLDNMKIAEIGIGNGGLAMHILKNFNVKSYTFLDIPEVLELSKKILDDFETSNSLEFISCYDFEELDCDLLISNYAFSELTLANQLEYFDKVITNSKFGYMLYNQIQPQTSSSLTAADFIQKLGRGKISAEVPLSFKGNVLVEW